MTVREAPTRRSCGIDSGFRMNSEAMILLSSRMRQSVSR